MKFDLKPYKLKNIIQHYDWGNCNQAAFIPQLLGITPEKNKPYAEMWMGVHPNAPSSIYFGDDTALLSEFVNSDPKMILGNNAAKQFDNRLPFLFKILSAGEALSIQAHPNKKQAEKLHAKDPKNYPDDNHKPEIAIAIDELWALVGFKSVDKLKQALSDYPEMSEFIGRDLVEPFLEGSEPEKAFEQLKILFRTLMINSTNQLDLLKSSLEELSLRLADKPELKKEEKLFLQLHKKYGPDVGLYNLFFLDLVKLESGQGVFLPAGVPHAYLEGNIIECMANSDNVVRAGLTPKFKDVNALLDILVFNKDQTPFIFPDNNEKMFHYPVPIREFEIMRLNLDANEEFNIATKDSIQMAIILQGFVNISWSKKDSLQKQSFKKGDSFIIPASLNSYSIFAPENSLIFIVNIGD